MSFRLAAARGVVWVAAERWGNQLLGATVFLVLARVLDNRVFGIVALANLLIGFMQLFVDQGISVALVQRKTVDKTHLDTAFWINLTVALALALIIVILARPAAAMLGDPEVAIVLVVLASSLPLAGLSVVPAALLERNLQFNVLASRSLVTTMVAGVAGVSAAWLGWGVWSLVIQQLTAAVVGSVLLSFAVAWRPGFAATWQAFSELVTFSGTLLLNNLLWFVSQRVDQALLARGLGVVALGTYSVALRVVSIGLDGITTPVQRVALPLFAGVQTESERLLNAFVRGTSLVCLVTLPSLIGLLMVAPELIPFVLGHKWNAAVIPIQILCVGGCIKAIQTFVHPMMLAIGRPGLYTALFALNAIASTLGSWFAIRYGTAGIACAAVAASTLAGLANFIVLYRLLGLSSAKLVYAVLPPLVACGVMALCVIGVDRIMPMDAGIRAKLGAKIATGVVAYAGSMTVLQKELCYELWTLIRHPLVASLRNKRDARRTPLPES
jgi:O-antigen/teichoic acid export membrane protein